VRRWRERKVEAGHGLPRVLAGPFDNGGSRTRFRPMAFGGRGATSEGQLLRCRSGTVPSSPAKALTSISQRGAGSLPNKRLQCDGTVNPGRR